MPTKIVQFRLDIERYMILESIAAERGLSTNLYIKEQIEKQNNFLANDMKMMQAEIRDALAILLKLDKDRTKKAETITEKKSPEADPILLELLLLLREISQPAKVSAAQKKVKALGLIPYNYLEK